VGASLIFNHNEGLDFGGEIIPIGGAAWKQSAREGYAVPSYFGRKVMNPKEIADPVYAEDQYLGSIYPTRNWGLRNTLNLYDRITVYSVIEGAGGHYLMNTIARQNQARSLWPDCMDRAETMDSQPALWRARCNTSATHELWVEPADFVKLRNISVSYDLPQSLLPGGANSALVTIGGQNLWKWTKYDGLDPELTRGDQGIARREYYHIPASPSLTFSLTVTF
jgi:hypothetical protein